MASLSLTLRLRLKPPFQIETREDHAANLCPHDEPYRLIGSPLTPRAPRVALTRTAFAAACGVRISCANEARGRPDLPWIGREIFRTSTRFRKAAIAILAWLKGQQSHFLLPAGFQSSRDIVHYAEVFRLADAARLLAQPDLATARMRGHLALHGFE